MQLDRIQTSSRPWNQTRTYLPLCIFSILLLGLTSFNLQQSTAQADQRVIPSRDSKQRELTFDLEAAIRYNDEHGGFNLLIWHAGELILDHHHEEPIDSDTTSLEYPDHLLYSGTKSFLGIAVACMVDDGLLTFDERVSDTITKWQSHPVKRTITVRQLLSLTSGIDPAFIELNRKRFRVVEDKYDYAVNRTSLQHSPGKAFRYGPANFYIMGELIQRKLQAAGHDENPLDYYRRRIFEPIGLTYAYWDHDEAGNPFLPSGAYLTAHEWLKFGLLLVNDGQWGDRVVVSPEQLAECFKPTEANPGYGLKFWLNHPVPTEADLAPANRPNTMERQGFPVNPDGTMQIAPKMPSDLAMAAGHQKQRLYVMPSMDLVIVRQGEGQSFNDADFFEALLPELE